MKKYICAALALLLMATMFVGCGRRNVSDHPGGKITEPTKVAPTIIPEPTMTTHATTEPTHATTHPSTGTEATDHSGATGATGTTGEARSRSNWNDSRS